MKTLKILSIALLGALALNSCTSVRVLADYDRQADFNQYKTYAFYKTGIDKAQISDLDKKRILRAIDNEMTSRGFVKSESPDLLISIFTTERERVNVYNNNFGWGWGYWNPFWYGPGYMNNSVSVQTEGTLYIDLIDKANKELVWQGRGVGVLNRTNNIEKKEARIREFVSKIMDRYPPETEAVASN